MSSIARSLAPRITRQVLKLRDRTLLEGAMATSALVAMADRRIRLEEDLAVSAVVVNLDLLQVYDAEFALSLHTGFVEAMRQDYVSGRSEAMKAVERCSGDIEAAQLLVQVGVAVAKADAEFSADEVATIDAICASLGIEGLDALELGGLRKRSSPGPH